MIHGKLPNILIIDDEKPICDVLMASLADDGYSVACASDGLSGLAEIEKLRPAVVLLDIWMPGELDGLEVLKKAAELHSDTQFIIMSGHGTIETAVKAVKLGAWDFIEKPLSMDKISILIKNILSFQNEQREKATLLNKLRKNLALMGTSEPMKVLKAAVANMARSSQTLLIQGEAGSGRSLVAQNIHYFGPRAGKNVVEVHCGTIPEELQLQELFGIEKTPGPNGDSRKGKIELAAGGTLCLDGIAKLSLPAQHRLLEFLRTGLLRRENSAVDTPVETRLIAIADPSLQELVQAKGFNPELHLLISEATLNVPALRNHLEDVPVFLTHFGELFVRDGGHELKNYSPAALEALQSYPWPGNIREIRNFVERLYILVSGDQIGIEDLRFAGLVEIHGSSEQQLLNFREARAEFEKEFLLRKINENQGNISRTAEVIGLERSYLHRKIKAYGIEV
jgi:two-component system nitrogen regulation response regulator NtrX